MINTVRSVFAGSSLARSKFGRVCQYDLIMIAAAETSRSAKRGPPKLIASPSVVFDRMGRNGGNSFDNRSLGPKY
jgi:hypothetical protein